MTIPTKFLKLRTSKANFTMPKNAFKMNNQSMMAANVKSLTCNHNYRKHFKELKNSQVQLVHLENCNKIWLNGER